MIYHEKKKTCMQIILKLSKCIFKQIRYIHVHVYKSRQAFENKPLEYYFSKINIYSFTNLEFAHSPDKTDNAMDL